MKKVLLLGGALTLLVAGIWLSRDKPQSESLEIYFTCDTRGMLTPCNCFTGQLGGITRQWTLYEAVEEGPSIKVDVGDAIRGTEDYHVMEYTYILEAYEKLNYVAANLGAREAALDRETLARLVVESPVPLLSANLRDAETGEAVGATQRIVRAAGRTIGVLGVLSPKAASELGAGLTVEPMDVALSRVIPGLAAETDLLVLLAFADENELAALAERFFELDIILGGNVAQPAPELRRVNHSAISYVTNQSRAVGRLDLRFGEDGLDEISQEILLVRESIPQAEEVLQLVAAYREEVRQTELDIDRPEENSNLVPGVRRHATYVGSESCFACHQQAAEIWKASGHSKAWETLVEARSDADPNCISCHSVGFGTLSGYRRSFHGRKLVDVGCETCHGPGSLHVSQYQNGEPITFRFRTLGPGDCRQCHYGKFSRPFDYETWWPHIAHGLEPSSQP